ncbi:helix-turn-helix domain-containing protein [Rhodococcus erythropolis]|uniref:helix-turn-helix domain-containing protein n=1 Tax=Rhodococcus erythropolis TaxID=1833 RepID=UPI00381644CC
MTKMLTANQSEVFDIDPVPIGERGQWWEDVLSRTCVPVNVNIFAPAHASRFHAGAERRWINDLSLIDAACDPCTGTRSAARIANADDDHVAVLVMLSGCEAVRQGDETALLRAGDAVLWDTQKSIEFEVIEPVQKRVLLIPRSALDEVSGRTWPTSGMALPGGSAAVRLLTSYMELLSGALAELPLSAVSAARNAMLDLVVGATRPHSEMESRTGARLLRAAIDRWIDAHLLDRDLALPSVAAAHSVSVRTVQRIYGMTGETLSGTVRSRRLARARDELIHANDSITTIAYRWSFSDASHFSRLFKAQFGVSPSVYRSEMQYLPLI